MRRLVTVICIAMAVWGTPLGAATTIDGKPNNPYGVQLGMWGADASDYCSIHFQWARDLVGEWGYVRVLSGIPDMNTEGAIRTLAICRAKHLIPVFRGLYVPPEYRVPGGQDQAATVRDDGYPEGARHYGEWARRLAKLGARVPYYEVGNEINGKWNPEAYGKYFIAISKALKTAMPGIGITSAGLSGSGQKFVREMLRAVPEAKNHADCWGLHPYGVNHPPPYDKDDHSLKAHLWTAAALKEHGVDNPRFVMTESGYELGNWVDRKYPRITDELRGKYLIEAYETIWAPDPRVVTLTIFMLQAAIYPGWNGWVLIDTDCKKTETYNMLAAVPKPKGSDWMPQGKCSIMGKISDVDSKQGLERVFVYTVPGIYAAETDANGKYTIDHLPAGAYEIRVFRDGFVSPAAGKVRAASNRASVRYDAVMKRVGIVTGIDSGDGVATGWISIQGKADAHYKVDNEVKRSGAASQRMEAWPEERTAIWQCTALASAVPDRYVAAEVWVKGKGVRLGSRKGATLTLAVTDSLAQPLSTAEVNFPVEGDFDWTPVSVTVPPYAPGRRLVITCGFDAEAGTVWFDDPYCHYADYPVPSRREMPAGKGSIGGFVFAEEDERMPDAVVFTRPGNFWTQAHSDGSYKLSHLPAGVYDIWAFARGRVTAARYGVKVTNASVTELNLALSYPPLPSEVQNPGFEERGPSPDYITGWNRYGELDGVVESGWHPDVPEHPQGVQAHSGRRFAGSIAGWNVKNGGVYQTIAVDSGKTYEVSAFSYTYHTKEGLRGDVANRLGVDPAGGDDPNGPYVVWTPYRPSHSAWTRMSLSVAPIGRRMTVFLEAKQVQGLEFSLNCFDDVSVMESPNALSLPELAPTR